MNGESAQDEDESARWEGEPSGFFGGTVETILVNVLLRNERPAVQQKECHQAQTLLEQVIPVLMDLVMKDSRPLLKPDD